MKVYLGLCKKGFLSVLLVLCLLLCACATSTQSGLTDSSQTESASLSTDTSGSGSLSEASSEPTESEAMEAHTQRVFAMLDKCRPEEAYRFPDLSGEITDIRITVRERDVNLDLWQGEAGEKVYDIFYGYLSDGVWYDFPSGNYDLKEMCSVETLDEWQDAFEPAASWESCTYTHVVEIGPYIICAFPVAGNTVSDFSVEVAVSDTLDSHVQAITEYCSAKDDASNWHYKENMRAYGTEDYDVYMVPFSQWYFIVLEKELITAEYSISVIQDWNKAFYDRSDTYSYDVIMGALNR